MNEEAEFLRQLSEQPNDLTLRGVYADWLTENGRPAYAEVVRGNQAAPYPQTWNDGVFNDHGPLHHSQHGLVTFRTNNNGGGEFITYIVPPHNPRSWITLRSHHGPDQTGPMLRRMRDEGVPMRGSFTDDQAALDNHLATAEKMSRRPRRLTRVGDSNTHDAMAEEIVRTQDPQGLRVLADFLQENGGAGAYLARRAGENGQHTVDASHPFTPNEWWEGDNPTNNGQWTGEAGQDTQGLPTGPGELEIRSGYNRNTGRGILTTVHHPHGNLRRGSRTVEYHVPVESVADLHHLTADLPEPQRARIHAHLEPHLPPGGEPTQMSRRPRRYSAPTPEDVSQEGIASSGEGAPPKMTRETSYSFTTSFSHGGVDYAVHAHRDSESVAELGDHAPWKVEFDTVSPGVGGNDSKLTGAAGHSAIGAMRTVGASISDWMDKTKPHKVVFLADAGEPSRVRLYARMAQKLAEAHGYTVHRTDGGNVRFLLMRKPDAEPEHYARKPRRYSVPAPNPDPGRRGQSPNEVYLRLRAKGIDHDRAARFSGWTGKEPPGAGGVHVPVVNPPVVGSGDQGEPRDDVGGQREMRVPLSRRGGVRRYAGEPPDVPHNEEPEPALEETAWDEPEPEHPMTTAMNWHGGQGTALYSFGSGNEHPITLRDSLYEVNHLLTTPHGQADPNLHRLRDHLIEDYGADGINSDGAWGPEPDEEPTHLTRHRKRRQGQVTRYAGEPPDVPMEGWGGVGHDEGWGEPEEEPAIPPYDDHDRRLWVLNHESLYHLWQAHVAHHGIDPDQADPLDDGFVEQNRHLIDAHVREQPGMEDFPNRMSRGHHYTRRPSVSSKVRYARGDSVHGWVSPTGDFHPLEGPHGVDSHEEAIKRHGYDEEDREGAWDRAFHDGWLRVVDNGGSLFAHNPHHKPTWKQLAELKDQAITNHLDDIKYLDDDYGEGRTLWANRDRLSRRRYAAYRAPAGGMVSRGTHQPGGQFTPDMEGEFMRAASKVAPQGQVPMIPPVRKPKWNMATQTWVSPLTKEDVTTGRRRRRRATVGASVEKPDVTKLTKDRCVGTTSVGTKLSRRLTMSETPLRYSATDRASFEAHIRNNPDDAHARLVYADWLDENGEPEEAKWQRVDANLMSMELSDHGGFVNGRVRSHTGKTYNLGGGTVRTQESADADNERRGLQTRTHPGMYWPGASSAGALEPYEGLENGDVSEFAADHGLGKDDEDELVSRIQDASRSAHAKM